MSAPMRQRLGKVALRPVTVAQLFPKGKPDFDIEGRDFLRMLAISAHEVATGLNEE